MPCVYKMLTFFHAKFIIAKFFRVNDLKHPAGLSIPLWEKRASERSWDRPGPTQSGRSLAESGCVPSVSPSPQRGMARSFPRSPEKDLEESSLPCEAGQTAAAEGRV